MPQIQVISRERHAQQRWQRYTHYAFAAQEAVVPLAAAELSKAVMSLPLAFVERLGAFVPVAVLGLQAGSNLWVGPDGRWVGPYIPAALRSYPFCLARAEDGQQVLCMDEASGLLSAGPEGERFFNEDGQPTQTMLDIWNFLIQTEQSRATAAAACAALARHQLIRPWPITIQNDAGEQRIEGLFQIDEAALKQLQGEALQELTGAGALAVAYCQLLSIQHLPVLGQLAQARAKAAAAAPSPARDLNLEFLNRSGTISFGNLL